MVASRKDTTLLGYITRQDLKLAVDKSRHSVHRAPAHARCLFLKPDEADAYEPSEQHESWEGERGGELIDFSPWVNEVGLMDSLLRRMIYSSCLPIQFRPNGDCRRFRLTLSNRKDRVDRLDAPSSGDCHAAVPQDGVSARSERFLMIFIYAQHHMRAGRLNFFSTYSPSLRPRVILVEHLGHLRGLITIKDILREIIAQEQFEHPEGSLLDAELEESLEEASEWIREKATMVADKLGLRRGTVKLGHNGPNGNTHLGSMGSALRAGGPRSATNDSLASMARSSMNASEAESLEMRTR